MLGILGFIFVIIAPFFVYRSAKQSGRNAVGWALTAAAVGIGIQVVIPFLIGIVLGLALLASGTPPDGIRQAVTTPSIIIGIICLIISVAGVLVIMQHVAKIPEEKPFVPPPSPPQF